MKTRSVLLITGHIIQKREKSPYGGGGREENVEGRMVCDERKFGETLMQILGVTDNGRSNATGWPSG